MFNVNLYLKLNYVLLPLKILIRIMKSGSLSSNLQGWLYHKFKIQDFKCKLVILLFYIFCNFYPISTEISTSGFQSEMECLSSTTYFETCILCHIVIRKLIYVILYQIVFLLFDGITNFFVFSKNIKTSKLLMVSNEWLT